jgi:methylphosphotriester-DNA--protein-cysteine methyltransferase
MELPDKETCYRALESRDSRFDGLIFVGLAARFLERSSRPISEIISVIHHTKYRILVTSADFEEY